MKNFVQPGEVITVTAPYALTAGQGALVGGLFGVAQAAAGNGTPVELDTRGVFDITKVGSQAWTEGALIYWDNANRRATNSASGNTLIGVAVAPLPGSGAGETTGRVFVR